MSEKGRGPHTKREKMKSPHSICRFPPVIRFKNSAPEGFSQASHDTSPAIETPLPCSCPPNSLTDAILRGGRVIYWHHGGDQFLFLRSEDPPCHRRELRMLRKCVRDGRISDVVTHGMLEFDGVKLHPVLLKFANQKCNAIDLLSLNEGFSECRDYTPYFFLEETLRDEVFAHLLKPKTRQPDVDALQSLRDCIHNGGRMIYWSHAGCQFRHMKREDHGCYTREMNLLRECVRDGQIKEVVSGRRLKVGDKKLYPMLLHFKHHRCDCRNFPSNHTP